MLVEHQSTSSGPIIVPGPGSNAKSSFGTFALDANHAPYASTRWTTSAGSPTLDR
jgi:hypothetical protein